MYTKKIVIPVCPVTKPRMTQRDKWDSRPCVIKYWQYKQELEYNLGNYVLPEVLSVKFYLPMPKSWGKTKKQEYDRTPHQNKPDIDNLLKGFMDALAIEDKQVWSVRAVKYWSNDGYIVLEENLQQSC